MKERDTIDTHVYLEREQRDLIQSSAFNERRTFSEQLRLIIDQHYKRRRGAK